MRWYIGIDNGVSGTIGAVSRDMESKFIRTPVYKEQNYTKKKKNVSRVHVVKLFDWFEKEFDVADELFIGIERPMVNPKRFQATISAMRCLEATLNVLSLLELHRYEYVDSKWWQKDLLPTGVKGSANLKKASLDIGLRLFGRHAELIKKHKDADGLLIAERLRREYEA